MATKYGNLANPSNIPVTTKAAPAQEKNSAGGYVFLVDDWTLFQRFLLLGTEAGSYYASDRDLTLAASTAMINCIRLDGIRFVRMCVEYRDRVYKRDTVIFALLHVFKHGDVDAKRLAADMFDKICTTGSDVLMAMAMMKELKFGSSRVKARAFRSWYTNKTPEQLAYQVVKYRTRNNMSHDYVWHYCHGSARKNPKLAPILCRLHSGFKQEVFEAEDSAFIPDIIKTFVRLQSMASDPAGVAATILENKSVTWEMIPTDVSNDLRVQKALLRDMPMTATIRNLAKYTATGLLNNDDDAIKMVLDRLSDAEYIKRSKIHPLKIYIAAKQYALGHGNLGNLKWEPNLRIVAALETAFVHAMTHNLPKSEKRILVGVDISGSMETPTAISGVSCRELAIVMSYILANQYPNAEVVPFHTIVLTDRPRALGRSVSDYVASFPLDPAGTNCGVLFEYAIKSDKAFEAIVCMTDNETWKGHHPFAKLYEYRSKIKTHTKSILMPIVANRFSINSPDDRFSFEIVGADPSMVDKLNTIMDM